MGAGRAHDVATTVDVKNNFVLVYTVSNVPFGRYSAGVNRSTRHAAEDRCLNHNPPHFIQIFCRTHLLAHLLNMLRTCCNC